MASSLRRNPFIGKPMGSIKCLNRSAIFFLFSFILISTSIAQNTPVVKAATKANREKTYNNIVNNSITRNLSLPLNDSTEENWQDAFYALELINYKTPWVDGRVTLAFDSIEKRSAGFQRALLELCYTNYAAFFSSPIKKLMLTTPYSKIYALCAEYLYQSKKITAAAITIATRKLNFVFENDSILNPLVNSKIKISPKKTTAILMELCSNDFLKNNTVLFSFQRSNRNYPGLALIRDSLGNFITDSTGNIFSVPQLARSMSSLPFYLTNGNTPQGIFRMNGFDVSKSTAIGPTTNIQLMMPHETSPAYFLKDSTVTDSVWTTALYKRLLTKPCTDYYPLYGSFYAGKAGRTEIIAHGTTVNPEYYKGQPFYPHTPTEGCLSTKEIWSEVDGKRLESNQQKLVNALIKAGNANGYSVVIEIDDQQKPVSLKEILPYLKNNNMGKSPPKSGLPGKKK